MNRRKFLLSVMPAVATVVESNSAVAAVLGARDLGGLEKVSLKPGDTLLVKEASLLELPANPSHGDSVYLVVPSKSLRNPAQVVSQSAKIFGHSDPLVLDSLANFSLKYDALSNDWIQA